MFIYHCNHDFHKKCNLISKLASNQTSVPILVGNIENLVDSKSVATINAADVSELEANRNLEATSTSKKTQDKNNEEQITTISVGYVSIFVLLVFVVGILLLLYFFYDYMSKVFRFSEKNVGS